MILRRRQLVELVATYDDGSVSRPPVPPRVPFEVPSKGKWYGVRKNNTMTLCHFLELSYYTEDGWEAVGEFTAL